MSEIDEYADPGVYMDELEEDCNYGVSEFCINPDLKNTNCCFECEGYIQAGEEQEKLREEQTKKLCGLQRENQKHE